MGFLGGGFVLVLLWLHGMKEPHLSYLCSLGPQANGTFALHWENGGDTVGCVLSFVAVLSLGTHIPVGKKAKLCQALSSAPSIPGPSNSKA